MPADLTAPGAAATDAVPAPVETPATVPATSGVAVSRRRGLAALFLGFLWPGLGQLALGRRRAAALFAVPAIVLALFAAWQTGLDPFYFTASLLDDTYIVAVLVVVTVLAVWRMAALVHSLRPSRSGWRTRRLEYGVAAGLIAAILVMHGAFGYAAWTVYDTSVTAQNNDFLDQAMGTPGAPTTGPTATPTASPTKAPAPTFASGQAAPTYPVSSSPSAAPNPNRITFLLVGVDFTTGRSTGSTDTMMIVSVDTQTKQAAVLSLPRDTAGFQLYWGPWVAVNFKINGLVAAVYRGAIKSPDTPMVTLEKEVGYLVGLPITYYAAIDMDGFARMVDAMGGVDVYNVRYINDDVTHFTMPVGPAHLGGKDALKYVRTRENGGSDYLRASRQQQVLLSLEHKVVSPSGIARFTTLMNLAGQMVQTDFPLKTAKDYVKLGQSVADIKQCVLGPPYSWHPDNSTTKGFWTSRLDLTKMAELSTYLFGQDSTYYGQPGITPKPCSN